MSEHAISQNLGDNKPLFLKGEMAEHARNRYPQTTRSENKEYNARKESSYHSKQRSLLI